MPIFYRGAATGTFWHANDARTMGFTARSPSVGASVDRLAHHIARNTTASPYVSLTTSYGVAFAYAWFGASKPTRRNPAYVYEIQIDDPLPPGLTLVEPIRAIATAPWSPTGRAPFHHDGDRDFLLGVVDQAGHASNLSMPCIFPPGNTIVKAPALSVELHALTWALRDSEVLAIGPVPAANIVMRYDIY